MKYLKIFEKVEEKDILNLRNFCYEHLIELIDLGFNIDIINSTKKTILNNFCHLRLIKGTNDSYTNFSWNDIKDRFIPFYDILRDDYVIKINNYNTDRQATVYALRNRVNGSGIFLKEVDILTDNFSKRFKTENQIVYIEIGIYF